MTFSPISRFINVAALSGVSVLVLGRRCHVDRHAEPTSWFDEVTLTAKVQAGVVELSPQLEPYKPYHKLGHVAVNSGCLQVSTPCCTEHYDQYQVLRVGVCYSNSRLVFYLSNNPLWAG